MSEMFAIPPIAAGFRELNAGQSKASSGASSFAGELAEAMERVEKGSSESADLIGQFLRGENVELHTVALRAQEAQASFELFLQVRNKLIQGYQEIMRIQV